MVDAPYGSIDPNSEHQLWSRWIFGIEAHRTKCPDYLDVVDNARRYFAKLFKTVGRVRCDQQGTYYCLIVEIEGPPAHDAGYTTAVCKSFRERFMVQGFGGLARLVRFEVGVLAGDQQDGKPPDQMLVMPVMPVSTQLFLA